jgi:hypothetical protein
MKRVFFDLCIASAAAVITVFCVIGIWAVFG